MLLQKHCHLCPYTVIYGQDDVCMTDFLTVSFFQDYVKDPDRRFAADTVAAIGLCAKRLPTIPTTCLDGLLALVRQGQFCFISLAFIS